MIDLSDWPALVLTAGLATRLRPLSEVRAKAAMPIGGMTIIDRILQWLQEAGVRRVVLNLHHKPETITAIVGDGSAWGLHVRYAWERAVLGSAGGPRHALPLLDAQRFFIVNGDTLTDCDLHAVATHHVRTAACVTMAVVPGDVARYGGVLVDSTGAVRGFGAASAGTRAQHFIGVQAVKAGVFAALPDDQPSETVRPLYPQLIRQQPGGVVAFESAAEFLDVGTARDYLDTVVTVTTREGKAFDVGVGCEVAGDAVLERSVLWNGVTVGAGARLLNCVVADDVTVPAGAGYENSVLCDQPGGLTVTAF
ncbi:MAG: NTP transferase domain-containing protein [Acidobacteria bacterium]|nr:NTP transferase domain-containing protein [Acidobacteriota bacterium]